MTNSDAAKLSQGSGYWRLAICICARIIADDGRFLVAHGRGIAREIGFGGQVNHGTKAANAVTKVVKALEELELVNRVGDYIVAECLADIAAWMADELEDIAEKVSGPVASLSRLRSKDLSI